ncbi:DUF4062 domain-containing protein [Pimelobacter simplex]|uniref:DUF4062 domain-containing protein n=1 Tax=Nocardioides simplex TaxID=2045 RepID=UPI001933CADE|nr:hypothetical protein [Pimelobacter simplex]
MVFSANVLRALIASPGDVAAARDAVEAAIYRWNSDRAEQAQVVVLPLRWETDSVPLAGVDAQAVLNKQLVEKADMIFGVFHSRLGTQTPREVSGTAEEIQQAVDDGRPVHVYFADMPHPADVDTKQLAALNKFRAEMQKRALVATFRSVEDLSAQVRSALEHDVAAHALPVEREPGSASGRAVLRASHTFEREPKVGARGKVTYRTVRDRIVLTNDGDVAAQNVKFELESLDDGHVPQVLNRGDVRVDLRPRDHFEYPIMRYAGAASAVKVKMSWLEGENEHTDEQTLSF